MEACESNVNNETEDQLVPMQKTCCFCIPQRLGIIILALIKLVLSLGLLIILLETLYLPNLFGYLIVFYHIVPWFAFFLDLVDIFIILVVIISVCLKSRRIMKIYYMYSICVFGSLVFMCFVIAFITSLDIFLPLIFLFICFLVLIMQEYLNYLLKNEVQKLESGDQIQL